MIFSLLSQARRLGHLGPIFIFIIISLLTFIGLVIATINARPIQDDYATLSLISNNGLFGYLRLMWESHGGNLTPMLINGLFLYPSLYELNFWALALFPIVNYALLVLSIFAASAVLNPFTTRSFTRIEIFTFANLVFLGSESLFSPQLLEITLFSSAVLVHLWPVLYFFLVLGLLNKQNKIAFAPILVLGFMSGNSNIAESLFIQLSCILILVSNKYRKSLQVKLIRLYVFAFSNLIGALMIVMAPGFWVRASEKNSQGLPDQFGEFVVRFAKSFFVFSADIASHPMLLVFMIIGYKLSSRNGSFYSKTTGFAVLLFILLFLSLVLGASLAYPAWHQSIGLVVLAPFFGLSLGDWLGAKRKYSQRLEFGIYSLVILVVLIALARAFLGIAYRSQQWDSAFTHNACIVLSGKSESLIGTETIYPISNLGIEDMNRWPWMRDAFTEWVSNPKFSTIIC